MNIARLIFLFAVPAMLLAGWGCTSQPSQDDILVKPRSGPFRVVVTATGELQAKRSVRIYGPRGGRGAGIYQMKIQRLAPEGEKVQEGDFIAELDRSELVSKLTEQQLALQKAESQYEQAVLDTALTLSEARDNIANLRYAVQEKQYELEQSRYEAPATQQRVRLEYEKAERTYQQTLANYQKRIAQSVAQIKEIESDLNQERNRYRELRDLEREFTIYAPAEGMLIYFREWNGRRRTAGAMISPWDPVVATLPDLSEMESLTYINEVDIRKIQEGQQVAIGLDAIPGKQLRGTVTQVANVGEQRPNSDAKVFEVVIAITGRDTTLRPAMTTSNEILIAEKAEALSLPLECLHVQDSLSYVFVREGAATRRQEVHTGLINDNDVEILAGLTAEQEVFLSLPADTAGLPFTFLDAPTPVAGR
ncbi:MAG: HlyD family efflux transporter periplasmic adaptor subunit [Bacteroidetes bacterium]|nr:MAG: HlyD family efflux transporter periplasmic adaptor subunit [Bacteroidota bacterium]